MADLFVFFLQWLHVLFAIFLVGSGMFFEFFVKPKLKTLDPPETGRVTMAIGGNFTKLVFLSFTIIILSGLYRVAFVLNIDLLSDAFFTTDPYGKTLGVKMFIVLLAFLVALHLNNLSNQVKKAEPKLRGPIVEKMSLFARVNSVLGILIVFFAVALRTGTYLF